MKRGDYAALALFVGQAAYAFNRALHVRPVLPGLGDQYFTVPLSPLSEGLSSIRTLGYPIFHAMMARMGGDLASYPAVQALILIGCLFVFWWGLRAYGLTGLAALAAVSPLFWIVPVDVVMPETLAKCFAIAGIGFTFWASGRRCTVAYLGLAASLFLAYQMRPAFLVLVGFAPVVWLLLYTRRWGFVDQYAGLRNALAAGAACAGPLLLFCLLRLVVVGHFGLVSFGGQNTIGISVEMLSPRTIAAIPARDRPLAQVMYRARAAWPTERFLTGRGIAKDWHANSVQYTVNVNRIGRLMQAKFPSGSGDNVANDQALNRMSLAVFRARPDLYAAWLMGAAGESAQVAVELLLGGGGDASFGWGRPRSMAALLVLLGLALCSWPLERRARGEGTEPHAARAVTVVFVVAGLFFVLKMLLVILVEPPIPRYVQAAAFLLPCAVAALFWDRGVALAAGLARRQQWHAHCYARDPEAPDAPRALPWRTWAGRIRPGRRAGLALAGVLVVVVAASWWFTRERRFFAELADNPAAARARLLGSAPPVHWRDGNGATVLHHAALQGDTQVVAHLIAAGASPGALAADGATALHWAAMGAGEAGTVAILLGAGLDPERPGPLGMSPIHLAALLGNAPVIDALLAGGADPDRKTPGLVAPLHLAGSVAVARALLRHGAAVDVRDGSRSTPIHWAHSRELAAYLLEEGADINAKENWRSFVRRCTPLHKAVYQQDTDRARWLLERGADPDAGDINNLSPLYYALWRDNRALVELLIDHGADIHHPGRWVAYDRQNLGFRYTDIYGKTIGRHPKRDSFSALVPDKAVIHPLDFAAYTGNLEMLLLLLARGADLGVHNATGMSALHWATLAYRKKAVALLRSRDPDLEHLDDPRRPIAVFTAEVHAL